MSNLDLDANGLEMIASQLRELNRSTLDVEMIKVAGCRVRLKSEVVTGHREEEKRVYKVINISREDERPPGGVLRTPSSR